MNPLRLVRISEPDDCRKLWLEDSVWHLLCVSCRVKLIQNGLVNSGRLRSLKFPKPFEGINLLDVGCGGGILSEVTIYKHLVFHLPSELSLEFQIL